PAPRGPLELDRTALRGRSRLRHARQRGQGRALPLALRRAGAPASRCLPLRHWMVLPAQEEVDEGAALVRSRADVVPDVPPLPVPTRVLSREAAPPARGGGGPRARADGVGAGRAGAATTRARGPGAGALPPLARAARPRRVRCLRRRARGLPQARRRDPPAGNPSRAHPGQPGRAPDAAGGTPRRGRGPPARAARAPPLEARLGAARARAT